MLPWCLIGTGLSLILAGICQAVIASGNVHTGSPYQLMFAEVVFVECAGLLLLLPGLLAVT